MFCCGGSDEGHSACALQQNPEPETESPCESKYRDSGVGVCVCVCVCVCVLGSRATSMDKVTP